MIKLYDLMLETMQNQPKCIFLAGAAGSGKSYISKKIIPFSFAFPINIDDFYEELLKQNGLGTKQKDFNSDQLSQAAKLQQQAKQLANKELLKYSYRGENLIIDGTGASSKTLLAKKEQLEKLGYKTFILMIYVSPLTSLERNKNRDRSLLPGIVLSTWRDVYKNIEIYKQAFKNNFSLIQNNPEGANKDFNKELLEPYLKDSKAEGKPKTPEDLAKSKARKEELNKDIEIMIKDKPKFDSLEIAKSKINNFINGK